MDQAAGFGIKIAAQNQRAAIVDRRLAGSDRRLCGDEALIGFLVREGLEDLFQPVWAKLLAKWLRELGVQHRVIAGQVCIVERE